MTTFAPRTHHVCPVMLMMHTVVMMMPLLLGVTMLPVRLAAAPMRWIRVVYHVYTETRLASPDLRYRAL